MERIKVKYLGNKPTKGTSGSAGYDLYSQESFNLFPGWHYAVSTGLSIKIPDGYVGIVKARSGLSFKHHIEVGAGVIDSDYVGEIKVKLYNFGIDPVQIKEGDRIAQILFIPVSTVWFEEVEAFEETDRGSSGFGSTGV